MFDLIQSTETVYYDAEQGPTVNRSLSREETRQFDEFQSLGKSTNRSIDVNHNSTKNITLETMSTSSHVIDNYIETAHQQLTFAAQQDVSRRRKRKLLYGLVGLIVIIVIVAVSVTLTLMLRTRK
ncbi:unnamed protein product [Rotaria socialis]|uniref:Uncharacterized protein n=1 Tax=Rotaria socialis TaxID=392032 RepID=A0A821KTM7_9BILA|nr:unnamed protein product [Rotaria socialis]CAF4741934.1 unnamed protein product [Rotaria socialis]